MKEMKRESEIFKSPQWSPHCPILSKVEILRADQQQVNPEK